ncbi:MAG: septum formation initiator family protein [Bacteroidales bacterium]|nr:septum formation initiator family protein [Bacteroidales bacterium]
MWQKIKEKKWVKIVKNRFFLATFVFAVWIIFFDQNSLIDWFSVRMRIIRQERQIDYYNKEIKSIDEKLQELSSNKDSLEKFAREQYYFHEEDEDLYIIEEKR